MSKPRLGEIAPHRLDFRNPGLSGVDLLDGMIVLAG